MAKKAAATASDEEAMIGLEEFLAKHEVARWDYVLIGDGSGSGAELPAGWGCVSIERSSKERLVWNGCVNRGTVNFAEIMAYLQPLTHILNTRQKMANFRPIYIHIFSDSEYCANVGNGATQGHKNSVLWACFNVLKSHGFIMKWHWIRRESFGLNSYCDLLSKLSRGLAVSYNMQEKMCVDGHAVDAINP